MRLADPVMHTRRIVLDKVARRLVIEDSLQMAGKHEVELHFHCSERCRVDPAPDGYALHQDGRTIFLNLPLVEGASAAVHHGSTEPILGWVSRAFDRKVPAPTIAWRGTLSGNAVLRTEIAC